MGPLALFIDATSFATLYKTHRLVHIEAFQHIRDAIARGKQLKGWRRLKKIVLIEQGNPEWLDVSRDWTT